MDWCRLWHDLPNDPKWRTIAKISQQPVASVISVYVHLLVQASTNATERGRTQPNAEDLASALDLQNEHVEAILAAMQGRVMEGNRLSGWRKRQPVREDGSANRSHDWREFKKNQQHTENVGTPEPQPNATERNRTQPNAPDKIRLEEKKRGVVVESTGIVANGNGSPPSAESGTGFGTADLFESIYSTHPPSARKQRGIAEGYFVQSVAAGFDPAEIIRVHGLMCATEEWQWKNGAKAPTLAQWLLDKGWKYPPGSHNGNGTNGHAQKPVICPRCSEKPCVCFERQLARERESAR